MLIICDQLPVSRLSFAYLCVAAAAGAVPLSSRKACEVLKALPVVRITGITLGRPAESCWLRLKQQKQYSTTAGHRTVAGGPVEHLTSLLSLELELANLMGCARHSLKLRSVDIHLSKALIVAELIAACKLGITELTMSCPYPLLMYTRPAALPDTCPHSVCFAAGLDVISVWWLRWADFCFEQVLCCGVLCFTAP